MYASFCEQMTYNEHRKQDDLFPDKRELHYDHYHKQCISTPIVKLTDTKVSMSHRYFLTASNHVLTKAYPLTVMTF